MPKKLQSKPSIESEILDIEESVTGTTALFYGRSGTGKTALSSTFPKDMLVLDIRERGTETIRKVPGMKVIRVDDWEKLEEVYWYLKEGSHNFKTVSLDQITTLQDVAMEKVRSDDNMGPNDIISQRNWGRISGLLKTWLLNFRDLRDTGLNVVFLAHDRSNLPEDSEEDTIDPSVGARIMPSVSALLNGAVDIIGNTFIQEKMEGPKGAKIRKVGYGLRVGPHAVYSTKLRVPIGSGVEVPDIILNPTYEKLMAISRGEVRSEVKAVKKVKTTKR